MKHIVILGGGESGVGAAVLAATKGYSVFLSDGGSLKPAYKKELIIRSIPHEEGQHTLEKILEATTVVKSPGIASTHPVVRQIRAKNIPIISEVEFAYQHIGQAKVLAITGSNGKSTCTSLLHHICKTAELNCALVGNIGFSFAWQVAINPVDVYVVETSSFQLDDIVTYKPHVAILLNITEDHLDRYNYQFEKYVDAKFKITKNQSADDFFIYCADDEVITQHMKQVDISAQKLPFSMKQEVKKGASIKGDQMMIRIQEERVAMSIYDFALKGKHNQYNTMAAGIAASTLGIRKEKIREAVTTFQSLEHRMEFVATVRGVDFINDSKATNVNSTWYALESMMKPTILILGGVDKGNDYTLIEELVKEKVRAIVCLGTDNSKIHAAFGSLVETIIDTAAASDAVTEAFKLAKKGEAILLSPACASFDLFKNYEDRGTQFKQAVKLL